MKKTKADLKGFMSRTISKHSYEYEWPFKSEVITLRCKNGLQCIVSIDGKDYALNGSAATWQNLKTPHEAKKARIGASMLPFIDLAKEIV